MHFYTTSTEKSTSKEVLFSTKFAFGEWNSYAVKYLLLKCKGANFISHQTKWDISQCVSAHYFTFTAGEYFTKTLKSLISGDFCVFEGITILYLFLYFPGEISVSFLNRRQKYCKDENPLCWAHSSKVINGYFISFFVSKSIMLQYFFTDSAIGSV